MNCAPLMAQRARDCGLRLLVLQTCQDAHATVFSVRRTRRRSTWKLPDHPCLRAWQPMGRQVCLTMPQQAINR